ncbi:MAG TPA: outer membrane beta-barrel protein, partial [Sediminibacterium sp.]|nr:outer membrane beta-barrel protein [Sediminibacterium sp.]
MHSFEEDNELDHVAKKAAEAFDAPGMANWDKMQLILDKEMPLEKPKKRFFWFLIPAILLMGIGGYWWYNQTNQSIEDKESVSKPAPVETPASLEKPATIEQNNTTTTVPSTNKKVILDQSIVVDKQNEISSPSLLSQMGIAIGPIDQALAKDNSQSNYSKNTNSQLQTSNLQTEVKENNPVVVVDPIASSTASQPTTTNTNLAEEKSSSIVLKNKSNAEKGFFIGLTAGIDASTVHFNYKEDFGYNIGGIIGYRFSQHFSIKTGGIYTQKNYKMNGADFHAPKGSWVSNFKLETVTGSCDMWDIPLIGTYHFKYNGKGNYFASLGTSSYFMKKENYSYLYYVNN